MSVLVKMPHMEVEIRGKGYQKVIDVLKATFEGVVVANEKTVDIKETDWYKDMEKSWTPAKEVRANRNKLQITQEILGEKIGKKKQYISDIENGRREISLAVAKELGNVFKRDYRIFL
ncbi:MAG: helix-turn-helix transcriptional regulator [Spirochaetaceae bacterium]|nr:helix-turn-helix transcriptional regulator [Spirochaetaceae bacterium]